MDASVLAHKHSGCAAAVIHHSHSAYGLVERDICFFLSFFLAVHPFVESSVRRGGERKNNRKSQRENERRNGGEARCLRFHAAAAA